MKRILALVLAAVMMLSIVACNKKEEAVTPYEGTLEDLVTAIYEIHMPEFSVAPAMPVDIADPGVVNYYFGLQNGDNLTEAVWAETMFGSQPYSMCIARVKEGADMAAIKQEIFDNMDMRKWMCVAADHMIVGDARDLVIMVMVGHEFGGSEMTNALYDAFVSVVGNPGEKLEK